MNFKVIPSEQTPAVPPMGDVKQFIKSHEEQLNAFLQFASSQPRAVGLAANQVSLNGVRFMHRVFAMVDLNDKMWRLIIDPVIDEYIGMKELKVEGCLTWQGSKIVAMRSRAVRVSYYNYQGDRVSEIYKGLAGQVWQHECDHLNGVPQQVELPSYTLPWVKQPSRNDACPCGSKKKYKHCCLLLIQPIPNSI